MEYNSYPKAEEFHAFEFVQKLKEKGRVKHLGFSFHGDAELLEKILTRHPEMEYVQLQLNYLDWEDEHIQSRLCYETAARYGKPVIVMEPVKGGCLATVPSKAEKLLHDFHPDQSNASWAVRFAASPENVMVVLSGMSNSDQMEDNIGYMKYFSACEQGGKGYFKTGGGDHPEFYRDFLYSLSLLYGWMSKAHCNSGVFRPLQ